MVYVQKIAALQNDLRIAYLDHQSESQAKGVIALIHGFPQTAYQLRKVINPLATAGYRVVAPDYQGAGLSSKLKPLPWQTTFLFFWIILKSMRKFTSSVMILAE
ncbi:hypothetical protein EDB81DRAFT_875825 [Dactylonectria macrodidyma]|uniref:AB hydrolase-1 domain-containing protein n=1 Tax=Dactylonectria macrodidyma TaxID=307937 RepID=A0A9P9FW32_9HYPO|nr:hypothetical protein EDB81DRAFT_875825 [Dactylonectria macrodidyma]